MKERKPMYLRHFFKKLLPCLITAVLVGASCTAGLYGIRYQSVRNSTQWLYDYFLTDFRSMDITKMTDDYLNWYLAKVSADYAYLDKIDRAFQLERMDTGEVWNSAPMLWAAYHVQLTTDTREFFSYDEGLMAVYAQLSSLCRKYWYTEKKYALRVEVQDYYVQEESETFLPGKVNIIRYSLQDASKEIMESFDLTPADTSGYTQITRSGNRGFFCELIGSAQDSEALALLQKQGDTERSRGFLFPPPGEPLEVITEKGTMFMAENGKGVECELRCAVYYHFWEEQKGRLLIGYGVLFLLTCITAAIMAGFSFVRARKVWEMAEYRRNLTNTLAHDLKSPLTAIAGYAENLHSGAHKAKQDYYTDAILQNVQYMNRMIADVLELADLEKTNVVRKEPTDVIALLREAFLQYDPELAERHITLHIDGDCTVQADPRMMMQAAANLASNAVRYTPDGKTITVSGSVRQLTVSNACEDIADAGALTDAFTKNDTARSNRSGSGLGLTIVRQIMELHGFGLALKAGDGQFTAELQFPVK